MNLRPLPFLLCVSMAVAACSAKGAPVQESRGSHGSAEAPYAPAGFDTRLLSVLACPENLSPLHLATSAELEAIREDVKTGKVRLRNGNRGDPTFDGLLIREDRRVAYPIRGGVAELRPEDGLAMDPSVGLPHPDRIR